MGLPQILIEFISKGTDAVARSARGVVAVILYDDTVPEDKLNIYSSLAKVDYTKWSEKSREYLKLVFMGTPIKVVALRVPVATADLQDAMNTLRDLNWNYLAVPGIAPAQLTELAAWIKEQRENNHKTFKAVLPKTAADHEGIVNLTTDSFTILDGEEQKEYSCAEYCARIAGLLAGLPLSRSCTYYTLDEIVKCEVPNDPDVRIDKGELVVVYDADHYMIGRGVNSLVSTTGAKGKDRKKIKIIEGVDMYLDDVRSTFKNFYIGKVINDYDNKQALVAAVNSYHRALEGDVLDATFDNVAEIDVAAQRDYLEAEGTDTEDMSDLQILQTNTGSMVFLKASIKFVDAMEDLVMLVNM